jgi:hypothetical protein
LVQNQHFTVRLTVEELNIHRGTVQLILMENMEMKKICMKTVPKNFINQSSGYDIYRRHTFLTSWKVPRLLLLFLTISVKEDERGGQGHTPTSLLHQSAT